MEGGEVDLFGVDQLIICRVAEIVDVFGEKDVGGCLAGQKDDLGAACC